MSPLPCNAPPQVPLYQYQSAPVPKLPPVILKIVESPEHIVVKVAVTELAEDEGGKKHSPKSPH